MMIDLKTQAMAEYHLEEAGLMKQGYWHETQME
jgi:hypothetical protein